MKAQDSISSRIQTFPIPNIDKLDDIMVQVPKVIILNKQIYEILFSILQVHPCYLVNWICGAMRHEIDLFDSHPSAFLDEDETYTGIKNKEESFQSIAKKSIATDEYSYLLSAVFGGLKTIRNDNRILNTLMIIGIKVFEYELNESTSSNSKIDYTLEDILENRIECVFLKIHRLVF